MSTKSKPAIGKGRGRKPLAVPTEAHKIHMRPETWAALVKAAGSPRKVGAWLDKLHHDISNLTRYDMEYQDECGPWMGQDPVGAYVEFDELAKIVGLKS